MADASGIAKDPSYTNKNRYLLTWNCGTNLHMNYLILFIFKCLVHIIIVVIVCLVKKRLRCMACLFNYLLS